MNRPGQFVFQRGVDKPVPLDQAFSLEGLGNHLHAEVAFARHAAQMIARPGMARMFRRFILNNEA